MSKQIIQLKFRSAVISVMATAALSTNSNENRPAEATTLLSYIQHSVAKKIALHRYPKAFNWILKSRHFVIQIVTESWYPQVFKVTSESRYQVSVSNTN